jgi:hypothetical protein
MRGILFLGFFLVFSSCKNAGQDFQTLSEDQKKELAVLEVELRQEATLVTACTKDEDCNTLGFKPKPCNGYVDYVALSQISNREGQATEHLPSDSYLLLVTRIQGYEGRVRDYYRENDINYCLPVVEDQPLSKCVASKCELQPVQSFDPSLINNDE